MPARGLEARRADGGFSMVEIVVVLLILGIIGGIGANVLQSMANGQPAPMTAATGGIVWRGIEAWRTEQGAGLLPATNLLLASNGRGGFGGGLVDGAGSQLVPAWPTAKKDVPVRIQAGASTTAPQSSAAWANGLVYYASVDRRTGWIAAYGSGGRLVFRRSITAGAAPEAPIG